MDIMSYHVFVNNNNSTIIFSCRDKLFSYYLSKYFVILENNSSALRDMHMRANQIINAEIVHKNDFAMACYREINSSANNLKRITIVLVCRNNLH